VGINRFPADTPEQLDAIAGECARQGVPCAVVEAFARGGEGAKELAATVVRTIESHPSPEVWPIYALDEPLEQKIRKVAVQVYGAEGVTFSEEARAKLELYAGWGFAGLAVCVAKTQYSLSDNPKWMGAPTGWMLHITDVSLSAGAGFVVAIAGNMMLMPGLPRVSRALSIDVDEDGNIVGV
jgi:formate--tetrahydrofolate ligase